jgi:uncharacterized protein (TIGR02145 family)
MAQKKLILGIALLLVFRLTQINSQPVTDIESNIYKTVTIGTQTWMAENLKTTKYSNGDAIGSTTPANVSLKGINNPKFQWAYDGDERNVAIYGRLYTWYAVTDSRNVCPTGWHVPTRDDWSTLEEYVGGGILDGGKLKESGNLHWEKPNKGATNETGFTALPGGFRAETSWDSYRFIGLEEGGSWWSSEERSKFEGSSVGLSYSQRTISSSPSPKDNGLSVRCIKDKELINAPVKEKDIKSTETVTSTQAIVRGLKDTDGEEYDYYGAILNNMPDGNGVANYKNGNIFTGLFKDGKKDGRGIYKLVNGDRFEGDFKEDIKNGKGTYIWADGDLFEGEYKDGMRNGKGIFITTYGDRYEGDYKDSKKNGMGTYTVNPDGNVLNCPGSVKYIGNWLDNNKHGLGKCFGKDGKLIYEGEFVNDKPTQTYPSNNQKESYLVVEQLQIQPQTVIDIEGNVYKTVTIGTQTWMAENLKTTKFKNGDPIPLLTDDKAWSNHYLSFGYCWYDNDESSYKDTYGALYNWHTAIDISGLCPSGWHVADDSDWATLSTFLKGDRVAGGKLKETGMNHWMAPNKKATDEYGFTARPGSWRLASGEFVPYIGYAGVWWSVPQFANFGQLYDAIVSKSPGGVRTIDTWKANMKKADFHKDCGVSVRCVKDN